ncbi:FAD dependent oxidoreductase [Naematelia encephala]|uniref:FAD dependent oxidoreductase n=1 Tax=Naematelia encephala TaxID=71784 RepID=A0A1Y2AEU7_9TREE|nr:FAD dependent oxidoreductase [Naematelia encephala]
MSNPSQSILIIGAGVFGLSTAIHLAKRGYKDVTVIDRQPFDKNFYHPDDGCDGASADINKVFRTTYGDRKMYQDLALAALPIWRVWTAEVQASSPSDLPDGLDPSDELLSESGFMRTGSGAQLSDFHKACLAGIEADNRRERVFVLKNQDDFKRAKEADELQPGYHWADKLNRYNGLLRGDIHGLLDRDAGFTKADKACVWALHLAKKAGVNFILDSKAGAFSSFITTGTEGDRRVLGVQTQDGKEHRADKVIVACGGWTASVVPEVSSLLETTGGSLAFIDIPRDRPDLLQRFGPKEFCTWSFESAEGTGMGGFPATEDGRLKFGYREVKYTNFVTHPVTGTRLSVPRTKYSPDPIHNIPLHALENIKRIIRSIYPELAAIGITETRICWYTDSIDNHFVGDYVPGYGETLFVASGGSGHGFKFLPVFGENFVNQLEHKQDEFTQYWKWRKPVPGQRANGLEQGEDGPRVLDKVKLATKDDWKFGDESLVSA